MFWTDINTKEPFRQNRWYILFGNQLLENYRFALKECTKPSFEINVGEHRLLTHYVKLPGNLKWKPIDIKFVSMADIKEKSTSNSLLQFVKSLGYNLPSTQHQTTQHQSISKEKCLNITLFQVDEDGQHIEEWNLFNCWFSSINFGSLNYENEGFVDISCTVQYDYAELTDSEFEDLTPGLTPGFPPG